MLCIRDALLRNEIMTLGTHWSSFQTWRAGAIACQIIQLSQLVGMGRVEALQRQNNYQCGVTGVATGVHNWN